MKSQNRDYTFLTGIAEGMGFVPHEDRCGKIQEGFYTLKGLEAPVDLTACAEDEISILKTAVRQLSERIDKSYHMGIERDLLD